MKTWEIMQHSNKTFKRIRDGFKMHIDRSGTLIHDSGFGFININDEWEEVKKPVDFMTAFKAYRKGKTICVENKKTNPDKYTYFPEELQDNCFTEDDIANGKWYIEGEINE